MDLEEAGRQRWALEPGWAGGDRGLLHAGAGCSFLKNRRGRRRDEALDLAQVGDGIRAKR